LLEQMSDVQLSMKSQKLPLQQFPPAMNWPELQQTPPETRVPSDAAARPHPNDGGVQKAERQGFEPPGQTTGECEHPAASSQKSLMQALKLLQSCCVATTQNPPSPQAKVWWSKLLGPPQPSSWAHSASLAQQTAPATAQANPPLFSQQTGVDPEQGLPAHPGSGVVVVPPVPAVVVVASAVVVVPGSGVVVVEPGAWVVEVAGGAVVVVAGTQAGWQIFTNVQNSPSGHSAWELQPFENTPPVQKDSEGTIATSQTAQPMAWHSDCAEQGRAHVPFASSVCPSGQPGAAVVVGG
jgi:hypothetical protein